MIHIRLARRTDAAGIARVHERSWKEAYRGLLDSAYLDGLSERRLIARWRSNLDRRGEDFDEQIFVASMNKEIIGFAMVGSSREAFAPWDAEISMIYVLKENRGGGIGRALMKVSADHCIHRGMFKLLPGSTLRISLEDTGAEPEGFTGHPGTFQPSACTGRGLLQVEPVRRRMKMSRTSSSSRLR